MDHILDCSIFSPDGWHRDIFRSGLDSLLSNTLNSVFTRWVTMMPRTWGLFSFLQELRIPAFIWILLFLLYLSSSNSWRSVLSRTLSGSTLTLTLIDFTSQPHTAKVYAAPPCKHRHMLVLISGCSTESPMQGFLSSFNIFLKYWIIGFQHGSAPELAMELCRNKEAAPRGCDLGWTDPLHCIKSCRWFRGILMAQKFWFNMFCIGYCCFMWVNLFFVTKLWGTAVSLEYFILQHLHCQ